MIDQVLRGKVALVAGAKRGSGRGIAVELGAAGSTVYVAGRSTRHQRSEFDRPETIEETAELVQQAGGQGIAVQVDHLEPAQVQRWRRGSSVSKVGWISWSTMSGVRTVDPMECARVAALFERWVAHAAARYRHAYHNQPLWVAALDQESERTGRRDDGWHCRSQQCKLPIVAVL